MAFLKLSLSFTVMRQNTLKIKKNKKKADLFVSLADRGLY